MEEVICRINPANSDLFAGLIQNIVAWLILKKNADRLETPTTRAKISEFDLRGTSAFLKLFTNKKSSKDKRGRGKAELGIFPKILRFSIMTHPLTRVMRY